MHNNNNNTNMLEERLINAGYTNNKNLRLRENQFINLERILNIIKNPNNFNSKGAIIADDVGLGKTNQILSALAIDKKERSIIDNRCSLLIVDSNSVNTWIKEINRFFNGSEFKIIDFSNPKILVKLWIDNEDKTNNRTWEFSKHGNNIEIDFFSDADLIITNYSKMEVLFKKFKIDKQISDDTNFCDTNNNNSNSGDDDDRIWLKKTNTSINFRNKSKRTYKSCCFSFDSSMRGTPSILGYKFRHIILDEAHKIRNHRSLTTRTIQAFNSDFYWGLTATPSYHADIGIWSLLNFIRYKNLPSFSSTQKRFKRVEKNINNEAHPDTIWFKSLITSTIFKSTKNNLCDIKKRKRDQADQTTYNNNNNNNTINNFIDINTSKNKKFTEMLINKKQKTYHNNNNNNDNTIIMSSNSSSSGNNDNYIIGNINVNRNTNIVWSEQVESNIIDNSNRINKTKLLIRNQWIDGFVFEEERKIHEKYKNEFITKTKHSHLISDDQLKSNGNSNYISIFNSFTAMRYTSSNASTYYDGSDNGDISKTTKIHYLLDYIKKSKLFKNDGTDKLIVYCERISTVESIQKFLYENTINSFIVTGKLSQKSKQLVLDEFEKNTVCNVLITTFCLETSLNLQFINHIIFFTRWWAKEKHTQCIGRAYRFGQKRDVNVTYLSINIPIERYVNKISIESNKLCNETIKKFCNLIEKKN